MKRARGSSDMCVCGHTACKKVVEDSFKVMNSHLSKVREMIDKKRDAQKIVAKLESSLKELSRRVSHLEEWKLQYGRHLSEFVKRESINVRIKYDTPLKKSKFGGQLEQEINQHHVKKQSKSRK